MAKKITKYLDYEIVNCDNSDGFVITKPDGELWECHLGNYSTLKDAKKGCVRQFMIARPGDFHAQVYARMNGTQIYFDYFQFFSVLKSLGIKKPREILCSDDGNCTLRFNKENI